MDKQSLPPTSHRVYEYISQQTNDPIVERKTCTVSGKEFAIFQSDLDFYKNLGLSLIGEGYRRSTPTLFPEERCRTRLARQNMRYLYHRNCDATGKKLISNISSEKKFPVYDQTYRRSDKRDFKTYGRDYDFTRPFFEQFQELLDVVPQPNVGTSYLLDENSEYTNYAGGNKNCYLIFHADMNRDCLFGTGVKKCKNAVDTLHVHGGEVLYQCVDCRQGFNLFYCQNTENCANSRFLKNCTNCKDCCGCVNLVNKQYCFVNKQLSEQEYKETIAKLELHKYDNIQTLQKKFNEFINHFPHLATEQYQAENCTGDQIFRSRDVCMSFDIQESWNMKYCHRIYNGQNNDCYDVNEYGMQIQKVCEGLAIGINCSNIACCIFTNENVFNTMYSMHIHHAKYIFGCIGAINAEYCILNKQYSKEEYEELLPKIVDHMIQTGERGQFFPTSMSPFGYNETVANEYFPITQKQATQKGYNRYSESKSPVVSETIPASSLPQTIQEVDESILQKIIVCEISGKPYRIIKQELDFYRTHNIPLPRKHPDSRHQERRETRPARTLYLRNCDKTNKQILSVYPANTPFPVYSEEAYNQEVFG